MKYSIIIPIYNAEKYLDECIMGIVSQKGDYELILVNDGSKDDSGKICDKYANEYPSVRVLHIENSGAGNARNVGAKAAEGEFFIFCDADDYISADFFEKLDKSDVDFSSDVIFFKAVKFFSDGREEAMNDGLVREKLAMKTKREVYEHLSECNKFPASCWAKIIKRDFYENANIQMPVNLIGEDIDWSLELILKAEKFDFFKDGTYYYRKVPNTRSSHGSKKNVCDQLSILEKWINSSEIKQYREYFESFLAYQYAVIYPAYGSLDKKVRKEIYPRMRSLQWLLNCGKTKKIKAIKLLANILGINAASVMLYIYVTCRDRGGNK